MAIPTNGRFAEMTRALKHRNYRLFFFGQLVSLVGTWMQQVANSWLIYRLTGSAAMLGWLAFTSQIPIFILSTVGGAFADRHDRRHVLLITQSLSMLWALCLAVLTLSGQVQVWQVFALSAALGITNAFDMPTRQSFLVHLVGKPDLQNAIALNSSVFNGTRIVGPAIAGILIGVIGEGWCDLFNGLSVVGVIAGLWMMQLKVPTQMASKPPLLQSLTEGFRFVGAHPPIRDLITIVGVASVFGMSYVSMAPIIADRILHRGSHGMGILMACSGLGAVLGALRLTTVRDTTTLPSWIAWSSMLLGVSLTCFAWSTSFWLSVLLVMPVGFSVVTQMASANTILQTSVSDRLRGRIMAIHGMVALGAAPIGAWLTGHAAERFGVHLTLCFNGLVCLCFGLYTLSKRGRFRAGLNALMDSHR